jgi:signal transduction histidine kinase
MIDRLPMSAPAFDTLRRAQLRSVATAFLRIRPLVVGPAGPAILLALWFGGAPGAQIAALATVFGVVLGFFTFEALRSRRQEVGERWLRASLNLTVVLVCLACAVTGGARSPMLPVLFAPVVTAFAAFGRSRESSQTFGLCLLLVAVLAALPEGLPFPEFPRRTAGLVGFGALLVGLTLLHRSVCGLTDAHRRSGEELDSLRREALAASAERVRNLEAYAGKLAHELKNPLASIKALSQLVARSQRADRDAERLTVLNSEIERMERTLEDYLSFSRPLTELELGTVELGALADEALLLIRPRASEARVEFVRSGAAPTIEGDPRRLREALLNLLSNALEASPPDTRVAVRLSGASAGALIEVVDSGRGIRSEDLPRVGTPFFTTRPGGTGLGVVIARGIAEQHGGRLELESELGNGTRAALFLPHRPPEVTRS